MRRLQGTHKFKGQEHGDQLAAWLNANLERPVSLDFAELIWSMANDSSGPQSVSFIVGQMLDELGQNPENLNEVVARGERRRQADALAANRAQVAMSRIFLLVRIVPFKTSMLDEPVKWTFEWQYQSIAPVPAGTGGALYRFVRLAESGRLGRMMDVDTVAFGFTRNLSVSGTAPGPVERRHSGMAHLAKRNDGSTCSVIGPI